MVSFIGSLLAHAAAPSIGALSSRIYRNYTKEVYGYAKGYFFAQEKCLLHEETTNTLKYYSFVRMNSTDLQVAHIIGCALSLLTGYLLAGNTRSLRIILFASSLLETILSLKNPAKDFYNKRFSLVEFSPTQADLSTKIIAEVGCALFNSPSSQDLAEEIKNSSSKEIHFKIYDKFPMPWAVNLI